MNLFILNRVPELAAQDNCDLHVRKIILEAVEMMGYAFNKGEFTPLPWLDTKGRHRNHPMSLWVRENKANFGWTLQHAYALCEEFTNFRSKNKKVHAYLKHIDWIAANLPINNLENGSQTDWPRCFGPYKDQIEVSNDAVHDYRQYYMVAKRHIAKWTNRPTPEWYR